MLIAPLSDFHLHRIQKTGQKLPPLITHVFIEAIISLLACYAIRGHLTIHTACVSVITLAIADVCLDVLCGQAKKKSCVLHTVLSVCIVALAICGLTDTISSHVMGYSMICSVFTLIIFTSFLQKKKEHFPLKTDSDLLNDIVSRYLLTKLRHFFRKDREDVALQEIKLAWLEVQLKKNAELDAYDVRNITTSYKEALTHGLKDAAAFEETNQSIVRAIQLNKLLEPFGAQEKKLMRACRRTGKSTFCTESEIRDVENLALTIFQRSHAKEDPFAKDLLKLYFDTRLQSPHLSHAIVLWYVESLIPFFNLMASLRQNNSLSEKEKGMAVNLLIDAQKKTHEASLAVQVVHQLIQDLESNQQHAIAYYLETLPTQTINHVYDHRS